MPCGCDWTAVASTRRSAVIRRRRRRRPRAPRVGLDVLDELGPTNGWEHVVGACGVSPQDDDGEWQLKEAAARGRAPPPIGGEPASRTQRPTICQQSARDSRTTRATARCPCRPAVADGGRHAATGERRQPRQRRRRRLRLRRSARRWDDTRAAERRPRGDRRRRRRRGGRRAVRARRRRGWRRQATVGVPLTRAGQTYSTHDDVAAALPFAFYKPRSADESVADARPRARRPPRVGAADFGRRHGVGRQRPALRAAVEALYRIDVEAATVPPTPTPRCVAPTAAAAGRRRWGGEPAAGAQRRLRADDAAGLPVLRPPAFGVGLPGRRAVQCVGHLRGRGWRAPAPSRSSTCRFGARRRRRRPRPPARRRHAAARDARRRRRARDNTVRCSAPTPTSLWKVARLS